MSDLSLSELDFKNKMVWTTLKVGSYSRWPSSLYCLMRNSDKMTIETTHPTLLNLIYLINTHGPAMITIIMFLNGFKIFVKNPSSKFSFFKCIIFTVFWFKISKTLERLQIMTKSKCSSFCMWSLKLLFFRVNHWYSNELPAFRTFSALWSPR